VAYFWLHDASVAAIRSNELTLEDPIESDSDKPQNHQKSLANLKPFPSETKTYISKIFEGILTSWLGHPASKRTTHPKAKAYIEPGYFRQPYQL
jgi:hypothetical protein